MFLWLAEYGGAKNPAGCFYSFRHASNRLLADTAFMLKAVKYQPRLYFHASKPTNGLLFEALSASKSFARKYWDSGPAPQTALLLLQKQLQLHDNFVLSVLLGISLPSTGTQCSPLVVLNQGYETEIVYKRPIAEFWGVPNGEKLQTYRGALKDLLNAQQDVADGEVAGSSDDDDGVRVVSVNHDDSDE